MSFAARARAANDTTRAQINNIPEKSHVIPLLLVTRGVRDKNRVSRSGMPRRERREGSLGEKRIYILCPSHLCLCAS